MGSENPVWLGEYIWEETPLDGGPPKSGPLPAEVLSMFRPQHCLLCGITTANMQTAYTHYESKGHFKKVMHHMREKYNALGSLKSSKEKFRTVKCDICNVELTSRIVYLQHYDGKQHLKNMKKRGFKTPAEDVPPSDIPAVADPDVVPQDPTPPLPKLGDYVCALCNVTTATRGQMQVHNNGSRHMKNVAKLADGELRDFYMTNGNCEPMDNDETDGVVKDNGDTEQPSAQMQQANTQPPNNIPQSDQSLGGYSGGYGPPGPPSMMQPFPSQMPYGSYPQYPMQYDYNSWGPPNMYPGYNGPPPYNGQYGPGSYGPGHQQYPPYGYPQGPPSEYYNQQQFSQGHQPFNLGPQQFHPGQQYNQGPQPYSQVPQYSQGQNNPEKQQQYDFSNSQCNYSERDQRPSPLSKDPRRHSRNREPPKDPEVNETPLPDGLKMKPLAVFPFVSHLFKESSDDRPPGVDAPPGIDKPEDQYSNPLMETPCFTDDAIPFVEKDYSIPPNDKVESKVEPQSPPRTLLDLVRENNKKAKLAEKEGEKAKASEDPSFKESTPDPALPPIPGLDSTPVESKPPIITWTEPKEGEPEPLGDVAVENDIEPGRVVPPPPHPLNPPIDFLPLSPEKVPICSKPSSPQPEPLSEPQVSECSAVVYCEPQVSSSDFTPSYVSRVSKMSSNLSETHASSNLQPHYSRPPVPSNNQVSVSVYSEPLVNTSQETHPHTYQAKPQPAYTQVPVPYISTPPVPYSQVPSTNYPLVYSQIPSGNTEPYLQAPSVPPQTSAQPLPQTLQPEPPPIPPPPAEPVPLTGAGPDAAVTEAITQVDKLSTKEDDPLKPASNKPKINSFLRRAAEKMFKEHKEKKMKEEAKKLEKESPKGVDPGKKSEEVDKEPIVIVPVASGAKLGETTIDSSALLKARVHDSVSETDNDVGSEPGEIVDKTPKTAEKPQAEKSIGQNITETETPKVEKSKLDFGSKKSSESRRKRSFRVRRSLASRSRSPKRRGRRRSRSWSPSPEKSPVGYYQRNTFQSYYGNNTSYWRNDRVQYRSYEDWNEDHNERNERRRDERDEFGRDRKWKEEKKREERKKKKRKSHKRSCSSSASPPHKASKERKDAETKSKPSLSPSPVAKPESLKQPEPEVSNIPKPVTVSLMQRLKGVLPTTLEKPVEPKKDVPAKLVEEVKNSVEVRDVLIRPDVDSDEAREVEKEEQEILKKVALIKKKLLEKEDEKPMKNKKRKKEKSKRRKKKKRSSSSSDSDSSSSDSSSSSSSSASSSSTSSSTSVGSEPKSKRIVESLLSKLSRQAATGGAAFDVSMLPALVKKPKKSEKTKTKKKKKDKKRKKKKKDKKNAPEPPFQVLSTFITPDGAYHCKCCNLTTTSGSSFLGHLISEKHKLLSKLMSSAK